MNSRDFQVGDQVVWDTFEGVKRGTVTAVGSYWIEVDGHLMAAHTVLCAATTKES